MGTENRMGITKVALQLFIKSLPLESKFSILGFGSEAKFEYKEGKLWGKDEIWSYNDKN
jgi:hypothetical protein